MCSYFIVGFFKNWVFTFLDFKGGPGSNSPKFWEGLLIRGGWGGAARVRLTDLEFSGWGYEKKDQVNISGWGWCPGGHFVYFWCFMVVEVHTVTDQILWNSYCIMRGLNAELNLVFLNLFTGEITFQYHLINLCNLVKQRS